MKLLKWLAAIIIGSFIISAIFHSYKYHEHYDDGNIIKIAYRGIEQFWHKHDNEYRISLKDLLTYKQMPKNKVYSEVESKGFIVSESAGAEEDDGYFKWHYKSNSPLLSKYEISYGGTNDTTLLIYSIPDKEYASDLLRQIISMNFIESNTDTISVGIMHLFNNSELSIKILAEESTGESPSQFIICKKEEFKAIQQHLLKAIQ